MWSILGSRTAKEQNRTFSHRPLLCCNRGTAYIYILHSDFSYVYVCHSSTPTLSCSHFLVEFFSPYLARFVVHVQVQSSWLTSSAAMFRVNTAWRAPDTRSRLWFQLVTRTEDMHHWSLWWWTVDARLCWESCRHCECLLPFYHVSYQWPVLRRHLVLTQENMTSWATRSLCRRTWPVRPSLRNGTSWASDTVTEHLVKSCHVTSRIDRRQLI